MRALHTRKAQRSTRLSFLEAKKGGSLSSRPAVRAVRARAWTPACQVSTLTPVSIALLRAAGAWERISASRAGSFSSMQVWDGVSGAHVRYSAAEAGGAQELGCVVENRTIHAALAERLAAFEAVSVLAPDGVASIRFAGPAGAPAEVATTSGRRLTCRLVVAADGARSPTRAAAGAQLACTQEASHHQALVILSFLRRCLSCSCKDTLSLFHLGRTASGIDTVGWSYDQSAVVGTVETDSPHSTAWQRFLPSGPIALLPVTDRFSNIVWTTTAAHAAALAKGSDEAFAAEVDAALQGTGAFSAHSMSGEFGSATAQAAAAAVGQIQRALTTAAWAAGAPPPDPDRPPRVTAAAGRRGSFPLALRHARTYFGPRLALVGDAAHAIHPLAGQGLNLGLSDAGVLAKVLAEASRIGADIGTAPVLARSQRAFSPSGPFHPSAAQSFFVGFRIFTGS